MRNKLRAISLALILVPWPVFAQGSSQSTDIARTALSAAIAYSAVGENRSGPLWIDLATFSRLMKTAIGEDIDPTQVMSAAGERGRPATRSTALACTGVSLQEICKVNDDGIYFTLDSVLVAGDRAEAFVRYRFTVYKGPKRDRPFLAFAQLRVELERRAVGWQVVRRENVLRS